MFFENNCKGFQSSSPLHFRCPKYIHTGLRKECVGKTWKWKPTLTFCPPQQQSNRIESLGSWYGDVGSCHYNLITSTLQRTWQASWYHLRRLSMMTHTLFMCVSWIMTSKLCEPLFSDLLLESAIFTSQLLFSDMGCLQCLLSFMGFRWHSQIALVVKNLAANAGNLRNVNPWVGKIPWRRAQQPTPVFLPGESHGRRKLAGYCPWGHKESDMTEVT